MVVVKMVVVLMVVLMTDENGDDGFGNSDLW